MSHAAENDYVEGVVCAAVTAAVEPVTMSSAAAGGDWCGSAQVSERGFGFEAVGVVADADERLPRGGVRLLVSAFGLAGSGECAR